MSNYYIVKHNSKVFNPTTVVKFETCSDSGKCYLISDLNDTHNREWIMYYDLYPVNKEKVNNSMFYYDEKYNEIAEKFIKSINL